MNTYGTLLERERVHLPAQAAPHCAIGRILVTNGRDWFVGTGALVRPRYVITAAHVLANATGGTITFGYDDGDTTGNAKRTVSLHRAAIPAAYPRQPGTDVGIAQLASEHRRPYGFHFNLRGRGRVREGALADLKGKHVTLAGYPGSGPASPAERMPAPLGHQYDKTGPVYECDSSRHAIQYRFDTRGGESGSPLMIQTSGRLRLIGVHTSWTVAYDRQIGEGTLLTAAVRNWLEQAIYSLETMPTETFLRAL